MIAFFTFLFTVMLVISVGIARSMRKDGQSQFVLVIASLIVALLLSAGTLWLLWLSWMAWELMK